MKLLAASLLLAAVLPAAEAAPGPGHYDARFCVSVAASAPSCGPAQVEVLRERGIVLVPHGVTLSLGSAEPPDPDRLAALARLARRCGAPLVSEHLAFVRSGGIETGHLLPLPRTRETLDRIRAGVPGTTAA